MQIVGGSGGGVDQALAEEDIKRMQGELESLLHQYEKLVGEKLHLFNEMLSNLREISRNNESVICADEEISRLKASLAFVQRDIGQKKHLLHDQHNILNELKQ